MSGSEDATAYQPPKMPEVRALATDDVIAALKAGLSDFARAPVIGLFFGAVYTAGGLAILAFLTVIDVPWMIFPFAIGFPLIGPFVAAGLYDVSRRLGCRGPAALARYPAPHVPATRAAAFVDGIRRALYLLDLDLSGPPAAGTFPRLHLRCDSRRIITIVTTTEDGLLFLAVSEPALVLSLALILFTFDRGFDPAASRSGTGFCHGHHHKFQGRVLRAPS